MMTMTTNELRTPDELLERAKMLHEDCVPPVLNGIADIILYMDHETACRFYKDTGREAPSVEKWNTMHEDYTHMNVIKEIVDYLPFAFEKALGERGISASRSIAHFQNWLWLIKDDELLAFADDDDNYSEYGLPILEKIKAKYGGKS